MQSVVNEDVHSVASFSMLHHQEVLMNVWLEFKNPRFYVWLCHRSTDLKQV